MCVVHCMFLRTQEQRGTLGKGKQERWRNHGARKKRSRGQTRQRKAPPQRASALTPRRRRRRPAAPPTLPRWECRWPPPACPPNWPPAQTRRKRQRQQLLAFLPVQGKARSSNVHKCSAVPNVQLYQMFHTLFLGLHSTPGLPPVSWTALNTGPPTCVLDCTQHRASHLHCRVCRGGCIGQHGDARVIQGNGVPRSAADAVGRLHAADGDALHAAPPEGQRFGWAHTSGWARCQRCGRCPAPPLQPLQHPRITAHPTPPNLLCHLPVLHRPGPQLLPACPWRAWHQQHPPTHLSTMSSSVWKKPLNRFLTTTRSPGAVARGATSSAPAGGK